MTSTKSTKYKYASKIAKSHLIGLISENIRIFYWLHTLMYTKKKVPMVSKMKIFFLEMDSFCSSVICSIKLKKFLIKDLNGRESDI